MPILSFCFKLRQSVIQELTCQFALDFNRIEKQFGIDFQRYFSNELQALQPLATDGLLDLQDNTLTVTPEGRLLIRRICMVFDAYLNHSPQQSTQIRYSRII